MPTRPLGPCTTPGCPGRATHNGKCAEHAAALRAAYEQTRPSATERGYDSAWRVLRHRYLKAHPTCVQCGQPATDVDHITPRRQGGTDEWSNLQGLCRECHSRKTALHDGRWDGKRASAV